MYFQYPLETLARSRATLSQLDFAREAKRALFDTDDVLTEPLDRGLAIFAANEEALEEPRRVLQDLYGDHVVLRHPKVRYMPGEPPQEPIMHVRITAKREHAARVLQELRMRRARILEECVRARIVVVRAEAPLAVLLGLPALLDVVTEGTAVCTIRLLRYAPVPPDPLLAA